MHFDSVKCMCVKTEKRTGNSTFRVLPWAMIAKFQSEQCSSHRVLPLNMSSWARLSKTVAPTRIAIELRRDLVVSLSCSSVVALRRLRLGIH